MTSWVDILETSTILAEELEQSNIERVNTGVPHVRPVDPLSTRTRRAYSSALGANRGRARSHAERLRRPRAALFRPRARATAGRSRSAGTPVGIRHHAA